MMMVASRANVEHKVYCYGGADECQSVEARDARILINLVPLAALPLFVIVPDKQVFFRLVVDDCDRAELTAARLALIS